MVATEGRAINPVVVVEVNNMTCTALIDTGAVVPRHPQDFQKN